LSCIIKTDEVLIVNVGPSCFMVPSHPGREQCIIELQFLSARCLVTPSSTAFRKLTKRRGKVSRPLKHTYETNSLMAGNKNGKVCITRWSARIFQCVPRSFEHLNDLDTNKTVMGAGNFSLHHRVQKGSGAHPASYPMGTKGLFPWR
jgi:hypothetical protein